MKKLFFLLFVFITTILKAQTTTQSPVASVEESIFGVQVGVLGIWLNNEARLTNSIALRTEIGLDAALFGGSIYFEDSRTNYAFAPVITAEPRWYYNLKNRQEKGRKIFKNNGNFVGLEISYNPNLFVISNVDNIEVFNQVRIIPKWAIRRTIGKNFTYEVGAGLGYRYAFFDENDYLFPPDKGEVILDLHIQLGYTF